jgi:hypothetical protein
MKRSKRLQAYAECTPAEYALVQQLAAREGVTISNFVRRCINSVLLEAGDDLPLLAEREQRPRGRPKKVAA